MESNQDLAQYPALELPEFDASSPFSILDKLSITHWSKDQKVFASNDDLKDSAQQLASKSDEVSPIEDDVLGRFIQAKAAKDIFKEHERLKTYDLVNIGDQSVSDALSQWPRSIKELENDLIDSMDIDLTRKTDWPGIQANSRKYHPSYLIKPILPSDFDESTDTISDNESYTNESHEIKSGNYKAWLDHFQYSQSLLPSLFAAAQGHSSDHFLWSNELMVFIARDRNEAENGVKYVFNISSSSAKSVEERFLIIGAFQRRLQCIIENISCSDRTKDSSPTPHELFTLASGLSEILNYVRIKLRAYEGIIMAEGNLNIWSDFESLEELLKGLCQMMKCSMEYSPPFSPIIESSSSSITKRSAQLLSLLYANLVAALNSCAPPDLIGAHEYLLCLTSTSWRKHVANWIGWPCCDKDYITDEVEIKMRMGKVYRSMEGDHRVGVQSTKSNRFEPWSGMEVEWSWDDREELDVGYTLRPVRLPSFLPIATARDLLEAGRALRLLKRAAPEGHPLLLLLDHSLAMRRYGVKLPDWQARNTSLDIQQIVRGLRREITAWRRYRIKSNESGLEKGTSNIVIPRSIQDISSREDWKQEADFHEKFTTQKLEEALNQFDDSPDFGQYDMPKISEDDEREDFSNGTLHSFIEARHLLQIDESSSLISEQTTNNLLAPMLQWSRLINESLISVFFRDLHLGEYLDVCRDFLLLGNQSFASRISEILFDDGSLKVQERTESGLVEGVGLSRLLLNDTTWPPGGSELPMALNAVVLENIASSRKIRMESLSIGFSRERGAEQAFLDLDDRLSFVITKPDKKMIGWHDRQSIEALDWLSISFQPPPLISPLITLQTQISYQRIFRQLLRLMRVDCVLKSIFRRLMSRSQIMNGLPDWMGEGDIECASKFRFEANHFVSVLYNHTCEIMLSHRWKIFRNRLDSLCRSAESQDDTMTDTMENSINQSSGIEETDDGMSYIDTMSELDGGMADSHLDDNGSEAGTIQDNEGSTSNYQTELKDIFSIAAYHERTLDRILSGCFLKARQKAIMSIISDLFNLILAFGQLIKPTKTKEDDELKMFLDSSRMTDMTDGMEASKKLFNLSARFQSKMRLLVHALELVGQRAMNREGEMGKFGNLSLNRLRLNSQSKEDSFTSSHSRRNRSKKNTNASDARHAAIEAEIARQEAEMRRDLEQLESTEKNEGFGDLEVLQNLIIALRGK